jgi:putative ABC transport system permease protein
MYSDIGMAWRTLARQPAFAVLAVATFALGAAANAVVLALAYGVLFKPLPFQEPDRLVAVWPDRFWSNADLLYLRERATVFSDLAAVAPGWTMSMTGVGDPLKVTISRVSPNLFSALGARPRLGRGFHDKDGQLGAPGVAILSHRLWLRSFGADPDVVGRAIQLDGDAVEIVGVMPRDFELFGRTVDLWTPFVIDPAAWHYRITTSFFVGRLRHGLEVSDADRDFRALIPEMRRRFGYSNDFGREARLESLHTTMVGDVRPALFVLGGASALILLIGGANVGTLLLIRAAGRARGLAIRAALGASRSRLARELLAESATVAMAGGICGLAIGWLALPAVVAALPSDIPRTAEIALDLRLAGVVIAASVAAALLYGSTPAIASTKLRLASLLRSGASTESLRDRRLRGALVTAEIALALVLTIGAGLLLQTFWRLQRVDTGFAPDAVLTLRLQPAARNPKFSTAAYYDRLLERIRGVPGVARAGAVQHLPFSGYSWTGALDIEGVAVVEGEARPTAGLRIATEGYFHAVGQPLLAGRVLEAADAGRNVVIINETFARRYYGSGDAALGRQLRIRGGSIRGNWLTVIGVVGDVRHTGLTDAVGPEIYTPASQTSIPAMMIAVRAAADPASLAPALRDAIRSVDPNVPVADVQPMRAMIGQTLARPRLLMILLVGLAASGLLLAAMGVYGVVGYSVAQRRREIGIRMALGAGRSQVLGLVLREGLWHGIVGLGVGIPSSYLATRTLRGLLFGVAATDLATSAAVALLTLGIVLLATYLPARRASNVAPFDALAQE